MNLNNFNINIVALMDLVGHIIIFRNFNYYFEFLEIHYDVRFINNCYFISDDVITKFGPSYVNFHHLSHYHLNLDFHILPHYFQYLDFHIHYHQLKTFFIFLCHQTSFNYYFAPAHFYFRITNFRFSYFHQLQLLPDLQNFLNFLHFKIHLPIFAHCCQLINYSFILYSFISFQQLF